MTLKIINGNLEAFVKDTWEAFQQGDMEGFLRKFSHLSHLSRTQAKLDIVEHIGVKQDAVTRHEESKR